MKPRAKKDLRKRSKAHIKRGVEVTKAKRTGDELSERDTVLRRLHEAVPAGIVFMDRNGQITFANARAMQVLGLKRSEIAKRTYNDPVWRITTHDGRPLSDKDLPFQRAKATGKPVFDVRHAILRPDGQRVLLSINAAPISDRSGKFGGMAAVVTDITRYVGAVEMLRESEGRYRQLLETSMDAVSVTVGTKFVYVNKRCAELLGFSDPGQLIGRDFTEFVAPEDREMVKTRTLKRERGEPEPPLYEFKIQRRDGPKILVETHATVIEYEGKRAVLSFRRDITERKRMEDELKQSEAKLKALHRHTRELAVAKTIEEVTKHTLDVMEFTLGFDVADFCTVEKGHILVHGSRGIQAAPKLWEWPLEGPGVVIKSVETKKTLRVPDTRKEPSFVDRRTFSGTEKLQLSELAVPVLKDNTVVGVLNVESSEPNAFTDEDQELLETLGTHVASALERLRQVDALEELVEERTRELKESEEKYRLLVDNVTDAVFTIDLKGNITFCSQAGEKMTGYSVRQLLSMNMKEVIAQEHLAEIQERLQARIRGEKYLAPHQFELTRADGKRLPVEMSTSPLLKEGHLVGIQGIVRDITERKRAEEDLRESEQKFRRIYNASLDAIYTTSIDGEILDMNPAGVAMFGFDSLDELKKVNIESLYVNLDDRKRLIELAGKGPVRNFGVQFKRKDGTVIDCIINSYPLSDERGRIVGLQGAIIDVSEHQEFQKKLKESEERFRGFVERSFDVIVMLDLEGHVNYVSPSVMWVTGYTPEEMVQQHFRNYLPKDVIPEEIRAFVEIAKGEVARAVQLRIVRKDGSLAHIELNASPIIRNGKIAGVQAIIRDVSERFKLMEMRDRFISTVTHELRTPLVSITGYLDLAVSGALGAVPKEIESSLLVVKRNTDRLLNLTNDLLDFRRLEAGKFELNKAPLNFQDVIKNCVEDTQPSIDEKKQILNLEVSEGPLPIQGDAVRLSQVLVNLLSNANKFAPESSTITLRATEEEDVIQVQVSDKGIGIKKEDLGRIFEPFAAIEKPSHVKGSGLGLSVSKGLIEAHGGKIWSESPGEEKGATFTFTLPRSKEVS